jgi:3-isopropylmalate/(R)-2-methylmalate dehydratase small subunit
MASYQSASLQSPIIEAIEMDAQMQVTIDLAAQTLSFPVGESTTFPIDPFSKTCLLEGVDQLGYLLKRESQITHFEQLNGLYT